MKQLVWFLLAAVFLCNAPLQVGAEDKILRAGIVGCDTSHVIAFTELINDPRATGALAGVDVTVAYPGGSPDLPESRDRVAGFVAQLERMGAKIVDSATAVADQTDAILLTSVDGRVHLEQFRAVARGKPVFVDKPAAASLADVRSIFRIADATETPCFSTSALRFCNEVTELADDDSSGEMLACETVGPLVIEPHHPDLFWYGVHGVESLYTLMGTGCETVTRVDAEPSTLVVGKWRDGRIGSFRGLKQGQPDYACTVYGTKGIDHRQGFSGYGPLVERICEFIKTGKPPVDRRETLEIFAFMEAADESRRLGGQPVSIKTVVDRAKQASKHENAGVPAPATR